MLEDFVVLGANSALPLLDRFSSSFVIRTSNRYFLIDAGEGCQLKLGQFKIKRNRISHILISHLHGDHVFGLPGLITSFNLNGRKEPLSIYGPSGIKEFIETVLRISQSYMGFELSIHEIRENDNQVLFEIDDLRVSAFPLKHRIPTYGYRIDETTSKLNVRSDKISEFELSVDEIKQIKEGRDIKRNGHIIANSELTLTKRKRKSFAYCSDTVYDEDVIQYISNTDILYHEATYLDELRKQADERMHTTAKGAATIALKANVDQLIIGHFSSRYTELSPLLEESQSVFPNSYLAEEGTSFSF